MSINQNDPDNNAYRPYIKISGGWGYSGWMVLDDEELMKRIEEERKLKEKIKELL